MKRKFYLKSLCKSLVLIFVTSISLYSQNCLNDSTGLIPIVDLESGFYQGFQGGLYFGSNSKPAQHSKNLNKAISSITPLNEVGIYDDKNGKIVLLSIGASNPKTEFQIFKEIADTFSLRNPYLTIVNGCQGGKGLQKIVDSTENYWKFVNNQLSASNVNHLQVQVIWLEEENTQSNNISFPSAPQELGEEFKALFKVFLQFYPNLQVCYLNGRGYSGYVDDASNAGNGLRQPRDYYNGWAVKWLIENQMMGDTSLSFNGTDRKAPLLDWNVYLWADGSNPRKDGFYMECPSDMKTDDGLHWSPAGNKKIGNAIFEKFYSDKEAQKWFLKMPTTSVIDESEIYSFEIYPNPMSDYFMVKSDLNQSFDLYIYSSLGELLKVEHDITNGQVISPNLEKGLYFVKLRTESNVVFNYRLMVQR